MVLSPSDKLSIAVIVLFGLALPVSGWVCYRQGFGRQLGWFYLFTLPIVRIVGGACHLAASSKPSIGLIVTAAILYAVGLVPLLLAWLGVLTRVKQGLQKSPIWIERGFTLCHLATLAALGLAIAGGVQYSTSKKPETVAEGLRLRKASSILLLVVFLTLTAFTAIAVVRIKQAWKGDRIIVWVAVLSIPFLLIRVIYSVASAFGTRSSVFNSRNPSVYAMAFMQILMEFITLCLYIYAGLTAPSYKEGPNFVKDESGHHGSVDQAHSSGHHTAQPPHPGGDNIELGTIPARQ